MYIKNKNLLNKPRSILKLVAIGISRHFTGNICRQQSAPNTSCFENIVALLFKNCFKKLFLFLVTA